MRPGLHLTPSYFVFGTPICACTLAERLFSIAGVRNLKISIADYGVGSSGRLRFTCRMSGPDLECSHLWRRALCTFGGVIAHIQERAASVFAAK